ncbi:MAG TPA: PhzF family phenazine biosynthesis protein [Verrucomicrobiae bacterium]|nr:PhzF family phenazine biosynthesis protein [Verrucomicrobiae bacterium]
MGYDKFMLVYQVDAFRDDGFLGNPAGVCVLDRAAPDAWMQAVAEKMNLAETAFIRPLNHNEFHLRWFTPKAEVKLCGHATLASAHLLWERGLLDVKSAVRFQTLSGTLMAEKEAELITLDFPAKPAAPSDAPEGLLGALGTSAVYVGRSEFDYLVEVGSAKVLRTLKPDFALLRKLPVRGVIITAPSDDVRFDFMSRFFAPAVGVDEDPVTGSAHCTLAPYWAAKLQKTDFVACQVSARGGVLRLRLDTDRVHLSGHARTMAEFHFERANS